MARATVPLAERFWPKVDKSATGGCWTWTASRDRMGYGQISRGRNGDGVERAHRVAWLLTYGALPSDKFLCHTCDVRHCVNPAHLFVGTHQDNMDDMAAKGRRVSRRGPRGGGRHEAAFSSDEATSIRKRAANGETAAQIAVALCRSKATIHKVIQRRARYAGV